MHTLKQLWLSYKQTSLEVWTPYARAQRNLRVR